MPSPEHQITLTEFEKITGISNQTISRAISQGKIPLQFVVKTGERRPVYIQPKAVAVTWLKNLHGTTQATHDLRKRLENYVKTFIEKEEVETEVKTEKVVLKEKVVSAYSESQNKEKYFRAQIAEIEYYEKKGSLVDKSQVQFQLFTVGKEIKNALLAIPDRVADDCFAAQNRAKVHQIILEAIEFELTRINDLGKNL